MTGRKKGEGSRDNLETTGDESGPSVNRNSLHSDFPLTIFTQTIMHLVLPHPAKIVHNHYFQFPLGIRIVLREIEGNSYAKLWGVNKVHFGLCENGENIIPN